MKLFKSSCAALLISMASSVAFAEISVIVSANNPNASIDKNTVSKKSFWAKPKAFLMAHKRFP